MCCGLDPWACGIDLRRRVWHWTDRHGQRRHGTSLSPVSEAMPTEVTSSDEAAPRFVAAAAGCDSRRRWVQRGPGRKRSGRLCGRTTGS